jgi:flagellin-like hook-associated protein FlgL
MSVVINTNYAATLAANNMAASSAMLQRSLNRLSSGSKIVNPSDDAGGLAVSMKLAATARRQNAASANIGNAVSYLQTQDGALQVAGKVLTRISELKTLYADPTKNSDDLANYQAEFAELQTQLNSLGSEKFNGTSLFSAEQMNVSATGEAATIAIGGANLRGSTTLLGPQATTLSAFTTVSGSPTVSGGVVTMTAGTEIKTNTSFTGPFEVNFDARSGGATEQFDLSTFSGSPGSPDLALFDYGNVSDTNWHSIRVAVAADGSTQAFRDGSSTAFFSSSSWSGGTTQLFLKAFTGSSIDLRNISVTPGNGSYTSTVAGATDLGSVNLSDVTGALQQIATHRATNGAQQSRLQFADEVLRVNKANIEAANSRINDVDVAEESTTLARYNILVQSGAAMLSQANQSAQMALRLLG